MSRISLKQNHELPAEVLSQVEKLEAIGSDTATIRGLAHRQSLFDGFFDWYYQARKGDAVAEELIELVRLKIARLNDCFTWLNTRFLSGTENESGLTEEKISQLDSQKNSFTAREILALEYAEKFAIDHKSIDDAFFDRLHSEFTDPEIVELGMLIGQFIGVGRLLSVLDLEPKFCET